MSLKAHRNNITFLYCVPMFPIRICQERHAGCTFKSGSTMGWLLCKIRIRKKMIKKFPAHGMRKVLPPVYSRKKAARFDCRTAFSVM